ncbi:hypothetical protein A2U01_0083052, partial [Trifolium medium]|nr:hypothetical protein [Trifolium medium]
TSARRVLRAATTGTIGSAAGGDAITMATPVIACRENNIYLYY